MGTEFDQVPRVKLPGGVELNGRQIYDDAEKELENIRGYVQHIRTTTNGYDWIIMLNPFFIQGTARTNLITRLN